jgi:20S proteasome subunit beta 5
MTKEEATELGRRSIYHGAHRDSASGGVINVLIIDKDGINHACGADNFEYFHSYINDPYPLPLE